MNDFIVVNFTYILQLYLIYGAQFKYLPLDSTNPTIVSPQSTNYPIWNIYFPAITICSNNKVVDGQLKRVTKKKPWVDLANLTLHEYDFDFDLNEGLKNAISDSILYEVEPHRIKNGSLNATDEYLLNHHHGEIPKAMQQVRYLP